MRATLTNPRAVHQVEQALTGFRNMAAGYGAFYRELIDEKRVPPDAALAMTLEYIRAFSSAIYRTPPPEVP